MAHVRVGDRVRLPSGVELLVSRVEESFFGRPDFVKLVEDTPTRWLAQAAPTSLDVEVLRG
ncbi:MAG: Glutathione peroxidase [Frankiales bacterium]|nr:Glutathione peroxidase [Frankiales bacterium]